MILHFQSRDVQVGYCVKNIFFEYSLFRDSVGQSLMQENIFCSFFNPSKSDQS